MTPNRAAQDNRFALTIKRDGRPVTGAAVTAKFAMLDMEMGRQEYALKETEPGVYSHAAPSLVMVGHWGIDFERASRPAANRSTSCSSTGPTDEAPASRCGRCRRLHRRAGGARGRRPGERFLLSQDTFLPFDAKISNEQAAQLNAVVADAKKKGFKVKVALISKPSTSAPFRRCDASPRRTRGSSGRSSSSSTRGGC